MIATSSFLDAEHITCTVLAAAENKKPKEEAGTKLARACDSPFRYASETTKIKHF